MSVEIELAALRVELSQWRKTTDETLAAIREDMAVVKSQTHAAPCEVVTDKLGTLKTEIDQARGATKTIIFGLGIPTIILSCIALWRVMTK